MQKTMMMLAMVGLMMSCQQGPKVTEWVTTSYDAPWQINATTQLTDAVSDSLVIIDSTKTLQTIEGFGTCFNELGWSSLSELGYDEIQNIMHELFEPGKGANLTMGRMPLGANDFSLDYYSYDETDGDFDLKDFSIDHDRQTLLPFVKAALAVQPHIKMFASPWCPPAWMLATLLQLFERWWRNAWLSCLIVCVIVWVATLEF